MNYSIDSKICDNAVVNELAKSYLNLKYDEFNSIKKRLKDKDCYFNTKVQSNRYLDYEDIHLTVYFNYANNLIREDKFYHLFNDKLIDLHDFFPDTEDLKEYLIEALKKYKVNKNLADLTLFLSLDNFYVGSRGLTFLFNKNQFGFNTDSEIKIEVSLKDF